MSPLADVERLVVEGRYGRADLALRRLEAIIPGLAGAGDAETLMLALHGRALILRQLGAGTQNAIAACDVLERAAHERQAEVWVAVGCALRARFRVDAGDIGGATADLARAEAQVMEEDPKTEAEYRLLDGLALVYAGLRLHDRADGMRQRIERTIGSRPVLEQAQQWSGWAGELAARAMEPLAGGAPEPQHDLMGRAVEVAARLDDLPEAEVPATLRRGARGVRALAAAYRGRPSEALRLLGPDAFGTVGDLPLVERQIVSLAAMRAHALVGSLATARSLDDAAAAPPATLPNLVLEVCRTRERLWLETYAGGDVIPVLHRMTELLVRLGWRGMDLVADTARQALEHQALRTESRTDALTGVGNRRALDEEMRQLLRFGPLPLALILVDIDHFKEVNDRFTHVVGDEVLRRVAASLASQLRADDQLLRYGGDEFVVLLPATGDEEANAVAERMAAAVASRPWQELADGLVVTVTMGCAAVWSLSGRRPDADAEKLFRRADERLLDGKRRRGDDGRGRGTVSEPPARAVLPQEPIVERRGQGFSTPSLEPAGSPEPVRPEPVDDAPPPVVEPVAAADAGESLPAGTLLSAGDHPGRPRPRTVFNPDPYTGEMSTIPAQDAEQVYGGHGRRARRAETVLPAVPPPAAETPLEPTAGEVAETPAEYAAAAYAAERAPETRAIDLPDLLSDRAPEPEYDRSYEQGYGEPGYGYPGGYGQPDFPSSNYQPDQGYTPDYGDDPLGVPAPLPEPEPVARFEPSPTFESSYESSYEPGHERTPLEPAPVTPARSWSTPWAQQAAAETPKDGTPTAEQEAVDVRGEPAEAATRPRRDPFGPPTMRQAIIDLSARKRTNR
ncbi:diguanylate cyclase [Spongisporangium articulatum]|uniref:Diguanylate cyclase n=1 Tax=Spongisporangium articulatum TaxID=3362603 RepID=A0ABW8AQ76_9ACTN